MPQYSIETHGQLQPHLQQEWLLTNGIGSFSSSSIVGCNQRRYHGLLCAATLPPVGRVMALSRIGEILTLDGGEVHELSVNQFNDRYHPRGDRYLRRFEVFHTAKWVFDVSGVTVTKELQLLWQRNVVVLRYTIDAPAGRQVELQLQPFVALRDFHSLRRTQGEFLVNADPHHVSVREHGLTLHLRCERARFVEARDWWFGHTYAIETDRGQDDTEDLFTPGRFVARNEDARTVTLIASLEGGASLEEGGSPNQVEHVDWDADLKRRMVATDPRPMPTLTLRRLAHAASDFIVTRKSPDGSVGATILAGYPWFSDWGRDTMISLPGLLLTTERFSEAGRVLSVFAQYVSEGMIPNVFDDYSNEPHYNTVDASLWFVHACHEYLRITRDRETFDSHLLPACRQVIDGYRRGTRFGIGMDESDGLITQGDETTQLTWMDAKCDGQVMTPRHGKAVEINALWYNALRLLGEDRLADRVRESFARLFWISPFRGLYDVVRTGAHGEHRDKQIRPNQIFAVSLPHSPLSRDQQRAVVEVVRRELLTPFGLRSLAPSEPGYQRSYCGPQIVRDRAYHNGTVWAWLIGPFLEAYLKVNDRSAESTGQARQWLQPLIDHLATSGCIGSISECFEPEPPFHPVAACAQAWSVAEVLRLAVELEM